MVQQELHPEDEGREGDRNPGQPNADPPFTGVPEAVGQPTGIASDTAVAADGRLEQPQTLPGFESRFEPPSVHAYDSGVSFDRASSGTLEQPFAPTQVPSYDIGDRGPQAAAIRVEIDDRPSLIMRRLEMWRDEFVAWVKTLASAAVYATLIVTFGFQVARVEGQSMAPTLADQDRLIVNKLAYRIADPQRGDIVMLYYPLNPDKSFVKRVIAEEGDTVRIVDGRVHVNDVPLRDDYVPPEYRSHDDWGPQVIPEGYYFVMGDHRNNSSDSRHWGFVPKKYIIGKVQLRWWPVPNGRVF